MAELKEIPFDPKELEQMIDSEFFLWVVGQQYKDDFIQRVLERGIQGELGEVVSRTSYSIQYNKLGDLRQVTFEDGTPVGQSISARSQEYIFNMEEVNFPEGQPPVLRGTARPYEMHGNILGKPLEQNLLLYMSETPHKKIELPRIEALSSARAQR